MTTVSTSRTRGWPGAEADEAYTAAYLVARDVAGTMLGAVATHLWRGQPVPSMNLAYSPGHIAEDNLSRKLSNDEQRGFLPVLLVGSRAGHHSGVTLRTGLPAADRERVLTALFKGVEKLAARSGAASIAMLHAPVAHAAECHAAWRRAVGDPRPEILIAPLSAEAVITPDDGESAGSLARRSQRRREQRRFAGAVDRVEVMRLSGWFDPQAAPFSYFNLTMYRPLDIAVSEGLPMVNLGVGSFATKRLRDTQPRYTAGLVKPSAGASPKLLAGLRVPGTDYLDARRTWAGISQRQ